MMPNAMGFAPNRAVSGGIMATNAMPQPATGSIPPPVQTGINPYVAGVTPIPSAMPQAPAINPNATMNQVPATGLIGSEQALQGGLMGGMNAVNTGAVQARSDLTGAMNNVGTSTAATLQADLTGANGPEKQQAAMTQYQNNPAMQYQMDQVIKGRERSAAARGGLFSGNTGLELNKDLAGVLSQNFQQDFQNLGTVADRDLNTQTIKAGLARDLADTAMSAGIQGAGLITQTAGRVADGRTVAGQAIAQNATQAASSISSLLNQQGIVVSDAFAKDISTITDMIYQAGIQDKHSSENLAAILANISGGQASTVAQGQAAIGASNAAGTIGVANAIQGGIQQGIANYQRPNYNSTQYNQSFNQMPFNKG